MAEAAFARNALTGANSVAALNHGADIQRLRFATNVPTATIKRRRLNGAVRDSDLA